MDEYSSLEEEEYAQLNHKYRQLLDGKYNHVEQLKSTDERKVIENLNHVRKIPATDIFQH